MSDQLRDCGVELMTGYRAENLDDTPDMVVIGNALSRGNPEVEAVLERGLPYTSGAQWLADNILRDRWVLAVAGTHGKTTTSSLLAWILEYAGLQPGFLIGGVPQNFSASAHLGEGPFFVVEADEYDTAFFDKRSKFVHYRPRTLVMNNLEFDHADIFADLEAIKTQFHHLVRTVPGSGLIIWNGEDSHLRDTLARGCWSDAACFSVEAPLCDAQTPRWHARTEQPDDGRVFTCVDPAGQGHEVQWSHGGRHNVANALAAIAAARHVGVPPADAVAALREFTGIKRRMEVRAEVAGVTIYDDFAHHPTAIASTLRGLRAAAPSEKIIALLEMRSNTMRMGYHKERVANALKVADLAIIYAPTDVNLDALRSHLESTGETSVTLIDSIEHILERLRQEVSAGDQLVVMSNGSFDGIHDKIAMMLAAR
jgi:UDP-N-acetylmuramate: L-alanyl-gamma-D-glutamyl-meso-diaminopimelate ligase